MKRGAKIILVIGAALCLAAAFFAGRLTAPREPGETFYAEITEKSGNAFTVSGLSVNDVNRRGEFTFTADEDTKLLWHGTEITIEDLEKGDTVAITYSGEVLEIYPAVLTEVLRIELLDDEK